MVALGRSGSFWGCNVSVFENSINEFKKKRLYCNQNPVRPSWLYLTHGSLIWHKTKNKTISITITKTTPSLSTPLLCSVLYRLVLGHKYFGRLSINNSISNAFQENKKRKWICSDFLKLGLCSLGLKSNFLFLNDLRPTFLITRISKDYTSLFWI